MQANDVQGETKGLFGALFDMKFEHFATIKFARIIYVLLLIGWALAWLAFLFTTLMDDFAGGGQKAFMILIVLPLGAFFSLLYLRVVMESLIVMFRIADNTRLTAEAVSRGSATPPSPIG